METSAMSPSISPYRSAPSPRACAHWIRFYSFLNSNRRSEPGAASYLSERSIYLQTVGYSHSGI